MRPATSRMRARVHIRSQEPFNCARLPLHVHGTAKQHQVGMANAARGPWARGYRVASAEAQLACTLALRPAQECKTACAL